MSWGVAPSIERLARLGFAAKSLLYVTMGALAIGAALGLGGRPDADARGAMHALLWGEVGQVLLAVIAIGFLGYAAWRIVEGVVDPEQRGRSAKGLALRGRALGAGLVNLVLAYSAILFALHRSDGIEVSAASEQWTALALDVPGGSLAVAAVALGFLGYGAYQLYRAARSRFARRLALDGLRASMRRIVIGVSRFGIAARGVVFGMIGVLFARVVWNGDAKDAGGVADSLRELVSLGQWPFIAIAIGLVAYGVYQLIEAKFRRIRVH